MRRPEEAAPPLNAPDRRVKPYGAELKRAIPVAEPSGPPVKGLPLGLRLGLSASLTVVVVLGAMIASQQRRETLRERRDREALLAESLAPLAVEVEGAASLGEIDSRFRAFQSACVSRGHPDHQVTLTDGERRVVVSSIDPHHQPAVDALRARVEVRSRLLPDSRGWLEVWQDASTFQADVRRRWEQRWLEIVVTALTIVGTLQVAIFFLISRPVGHLVRSLQRMETGHLGEIKTPRGAWEVRWLAWRLQRTALELKETVRRLVSAERRALGCNQLGGHEPDQLVAEGAPVARLGGGAADGDPNDSLTRQYLLDTARLLESLAPEDSSASFLAREAWEQRAHEAGRIGAIDVRARLENAALRILHPEEFAGLKWRLEALEKAREGWRQELAEQLAEEMARGGVHCLAIQHRVKHVAGVWRKVHEKELDLDQVDDLYAFRVIVPEELDCYRALRTVHTAFDPEPFRFKDYIAQPKANGYQSIHTSVRDAGGTLFEVQIRSAAMHRAAENGSAAHWRYKTASRAAPRQPRTLARLLGRWRRSP